MTHPLMRTTGSLTAALALTVAGLAPLPALAAAPTADTVSAGAPGDADFTAEALPTVQVDGIVRRVAVHGDRAYAVGSFTTARPAGAAPGTNTTPRANVLAFDLRTGELDAAFDAPTDGNVTDVTVSEDGSTVFLAGEFSRVGGQARKGFAAVNARTGAVTGLDASAWGAVRAVATRGDVVYLGGLFDGLKGQAHNRVAAIDFRTGRLLPFDPTITGNGEVTSLEISPDGTRVAVGGKFNNLGGSRVTGLALVNVADSSLVPSRLYSQVPTGGTVTAGVTDLDGDAQGFYGTSFSYGDHTLEGLVAADWDGNVRYLADCHGDGSGIWSSGDSVHMTGHPYSCATVEGMPERYPRNYHSVLSFDNEASTTVVPTAQASYVNFAGNPAPRLQNHFPHFQEGGVEGQAAWAIDGNSEYMVIGGEFPTVNGKPQQGLARFPGRSTAKTSLEPFWGDLDINAVSRAPGKVQVRVTPTWDRDDAVLTYEVRRDGKVLDRRTIANAEWAREDYAVMDSVTPGSTANYWIHVYDKNGTLKAKQSQTVTAAGGTETTSTDVYRRAVAEDGVRFFFEPGAIGADRMDVASGVTTVAGRMGDAYALNGTSYAYASSPTRQQGPFAFSTEAWIKTPDAARYGVYSGPILGFSSAYSGTSGSRDRTMYLTTSGRIAFGTFPAAATRVVQSDRTVTDGNWHHVVTTLDGAGVRSIYIDGRLSAQERMTTGAQDFAGYWRLGAESMSGWPSVTNGYPRQGPYMTVDAPAVYNNVLSPEQVARHYEIGSGRPDPMPAPEPTTPTPEPTPEPTPDPTTPAEPLPEGVAVDDAFDRTAASGWGPGWATWGRASVEGGAGVLTLAPSTGPGARRTDVAVRDQVTDVVFSLDAVPTRTLYATVAQRRVGNDQYETRVAVRPDGTVQLQLRRVSGGQTTVLATKDVAGLTVTAGQKLHLRTTTVGEASTQLSASLWKEGAAAPSTPHISATDAEGALTGAGTVGVETWLGAADATVKLAVDSWTTKAAAAAPVPDPETGPVAGAQPLTDDFAREVGSGWGTATAGGSWATWGTTSVSGGTGVFVTRPGSGSGVRSVDTELTDQVTRFDMTVADMPTKTLFLTVAQRQVGAERYEVRLALDPTSKVTASLVATSGGQSRTLATRDMGVSYVPGTTLHVELGAVGSGTTTLSAKMWTDTQSEPAQPQLTATDSTAALQRPGTVSVESYLGATAAMPVGLRFDDWSTTDPSAA